VVLAKFGYITNLKIKKKLKKGKENTLSGIELVTMHAHNMSLKYLVLVNNNLCHHKLTLMQV